MAQLGWHGKGGDVALVGMLGSGQNIGVGKVEDDTDVAWSAQSAVESMWRTWMNRVELGLPW